MSKLSFAEVGRQREKGRSLDSWSSSMVIMTEQLDV